MYKQILLTVDLEHDSSWEKALPVALEMCQICSADLSILTVVPDLGMSIVGEFFPKGFEEKLCDKMMAELKGFVSQHVPEGVPVQHLVEKGSVYEVILEMSKKVKADLIIVSSPRPELKDYLLGPNAARVVRHATCSVLVVRE